MDDYISREAALSLKYQYYSHSTNCYESVIHADDLRNLPAADVAPVVRCRECELWNDWDHAGRKELGNFVCSCAHWSNEDGYIVYTKPDDYCSYGERKDGADYTTD